MSKIGAHVSIAGGLEKSIERGEALGCEAIQIFSKNQLQWRSAPLSQARGERFYRSWAASSIEEIVVHASYLINLAATDATGPKSIAALEDEIERCDLLGIDDLVLHPGSSRGRSAEPALDLVAERLASILDRTSHKRVRILLETMAGQGDLLGRDSNSSEESSTPSTGRRGSESAWIHATCSQQASICGRKPPISAFSIRWTTRWGSTGSDAGISTIASTIWAEGSIGMPISEKGRSDSLLSPLYSTTRSGNILHAFWRPRRTPPVMPGTWLFYAN